MTLPISPSPDSADIPGRRVEIDLGPAASRPQLRSDAARNRTRLLEAATRLVAEHGVAKLTMDSVAAAAKVGKGTVFRRFGDRTGLLVALLDHHERQLQTAILSGPPPLGPGAPAVERLHTFGPAVIRHERVHHELYLASRANQARSYVVPPHQVRLTHIAVLLRQAKVDGDVELLAQTLLGYLNPTLIHHLLTQRGMPLDRLEAGWHDLVARLTAGHQPSSAPFHPYP